MPHPTQCWLCTEYIALSGAIDIHPACLYGLAILAFWHYGMVSPWERARVAIEQRLGAEHPHTMLVTMFSGNMDLSIEPSYALTLMARAEEGLRRTLGAHHTATAYALGNLACKLNLGKPGHDAAIIARCREAAAASPFHDAVDAAACLTWVWFALSLCSYEFGTIWKDQLGMPGMKDEDEMNEDDRAGWHGQRCSDQCTLVRSNPAHHHHP